MIAERGKPILLADLVALHLIDTPPGDTPCAAPMSAQPSSTNVVRTATRCNQLLKN
jgi:hypothetical protein